LEAIKARVKEMEEEAEKLKEMQGEVDQMLNTPPNKSGELFCLYTTLQVKVYIYASEVEYL